MKRNLVRWTTTLLLAGSVLLSGLVSPVGLAQPPSAARAETDATVLAEGKDFATQVLGDPWEMNEYSDISQYLNMSGQANYLSNPGTSGGVFTATSAGENSAEFYPLFPGYETAMLIGKVGHNFPILSNVYHCLYLGMKVESGPATSMGPDQFQIFWFGDERLNGNGGAWGFSKGIYVYPEAGKSQPSHQWKLYSLDLNSDSVYWGETRWNARSTWQGLRIDPTLQANTRFQVDWVRLTDCQARKKTISWSSGDAVSIYVRDETSGREFLVAPNIKGSSYDLDLQGFPAGQFSYLVKQGSQTLASGGIKINQTPIARFINPSETSGADFAAESGNAWDMGDTSDVESAICTQAAFEDGTLALTTNQVNSQSEGCASGGVNDPQIKLAVNGSIDPNRYQYLSFRMYAEKPWQNVPGGMIARLVWGFMGSGGRQLCYGVSQDIPFDVGWNTYTINLYDAFNGSSEQTAGDCPGGLTWASSGLVTRLRLDPNENQTLGILHQHIDWIRLIQADWVGKGGRYTARLALNRSPEQMKAITMYYTSDRNQPTQNKAGNVSLQTTPPQAPNLGHRLFLPATAHNYTFGSSFANTVVYSWDTSSVSPGAYYLCAVVEDDYNQGTYCSNFPVQVAAP